MDANTFDAIVSRLGVATSRREALATLLRAASAATISRISPRIPTVAAMAVTPLAANQRSGGQCSGVGDYIKETGVTYVDPMDGEVKTKPGWAGITVHKVSWSGTPSLKDCSTCGQDQVCRTTGPMVVRFTPHITVYGLSWTPGAGATGRCRRAAKTWRDKIETHENAHVAQIKSAVTRANDVVVSQEFQACGSNAAEAKKRIKAKLDAYGKRIVATIEQDITTRFEAFHQTDEGKAVNLGCGPCLLPPGSSAVAPTPDVEQQFVDTGAGNQTPPPPAHDCGPRKTFIPGQGCFCSGLAGEALGCDQAIEPYFCDCVSTIVPCNGGAGCELGQQCYQGHCCTRAKCGTPEARCIPPCENGRCFEGTCDQEEGQPGGPGGGDGGGGGNGGTSECGAGERLLCEVFCWCVPDDIDTG